MRHIRGLPPDPGVMTEEDPRVSSIFDRRQPGGALLACVPDGLRLRQTELVTALAGAEQEGEQFSAVRLGRIREPGKRPIAVVYAVGDSRLLVGRSRRGRPEIRELRWGDISRVSLVRRGWRGHLHAARLALRGNPAWALLELVDEADFRVIQATWREARRLLRGGPRRAQVNDPQSDTDGASDAAAGGADARVSAPPGGDRSLSGDRSTRGRSAVAVAAAYPPPARARSARHRVSAPVARADATAVRTARIYVAPPPRGVTASTVAARPRTEAPPVGALPSQLARVCSLLDPVGYVELDGVMRAASWRDPAAAPPPGEEVAVACDPGDPATLIATRPHEPASGDRTAAVSRESAG